MDISPNLIVLLWSRLLLIIGEINIIITEIIILINSVIGIIDKYSFLLFLLFRATNLDKAMGSPIWAILMNSDKEGRINIYKDKPSIPKFLVIIILINIPSTLVINPPIRRISVDAINFFFIINIYEKLKKIYHCFKKYGIILLRMEYVEILVRT